MFSFNKIESASNPTKHPPPVAEATEIGIVPLIKKSLPSAAILPHFIFLFSATTISVPSHTP